MKFVRSIVWLTIKELRSVLQDSGLMIFVIYAFSIAVYLDATGQGDDVNNASIAIIDEDRSELSERILSGFYPPYFKQAQRIDGGELNSVMDHGKFTFVLEIPNDFEASLRNGRPKEMQLSVDSTAARQASLGASYITNIVMQSISQQFPNLNQHKAKITKLIARRAFNPNGEITWFFSILSLLDNITLVTIILTGAALLREREHGTIEHLLVMPLNSFQIATSKIAANSFLILIIALLSLKFVVMDAIGTPLNGSLLLFVTGTCVYLFSAAAIGVLLATIARSMAQFSLLLMMVILPMQMLSGGMTPIENQPGWLQSITFFFPSRHYLEFSKSVLYRGADLDIIWFELVAITLLGLVCLTGCLSLFRRSLESSA